MPTFLRSLKLKEKYFDPHRGTVVKTNGLYDVEKVGIHEGPFVTSSIAEKDTSCKNFCEYELSFMFLSSKVLSS